MAWRGPTRPVVFPSAPRHNGTVRIKLRNLERQPLFRVDVDAHQRPAVVKAADGARECFLHWDQATDDQGHLRRCPVCGCADLFVRKDFRQVTGFVLIVLAALGSMVLLGRRRIAAAIIVLAVVALLDAAIFLFTGRCLVCYQCRSEFRRLPIGRDHPTWEAALGERYRSPVGADAASAAPAAPRGPQA